MSYVSRSDLLFFIFYLFSFYVIHPNTPLFSPGDSLLDPEPGLGLALLAKLLGRQGLVDLLHGHQLLDLHDHTGRVGRDAVEDGLAALAQAQGREDAARALG